MLKQLKQADARLVTAYLRTDNAGCYKGAGTLLAVRRIYIETGVLIRRFDFSDAQSGKGPCDRMAAVTKGNIRRFINEKNDCITSGDFVRGAKATHHMTVSSCRLPSPISTKSPKWAGVHNFNNLQYQLISQGSGAKSKSPGQDVRITVWRTYDIGPGQFFSLSKLNPSVDTINEIHVGTQHENLEWQTDSIAQRNCHSSAVCDHFSMHNVDQSASKINEDSEDEDCTTTDVVIATENQSGFVTFDCPEPRCVMEFRREDRLNAHLLLGTHKIIDSSCRLLDKAILMYKDGISRDAPDKVPFLSTQISSDSSSKAGVKMLEEGWGLFRPRTRAPFSIAQRSYLDQKYNDGEKSGAKWDPESIAEVSAQWSCCAIT